MEARVQKLIQAGLDSTNYRQFLGRAFEALAKEEQKFNFSAFSRKAGFSSRGFIKEVLVGEKRLTALSYPKVLKAMSLPSTLKAFFTLLVIREESELNHEKLNPTQIEDRIRDLKEKMLQQLQQTSNAGFIASALFKSYQVLEVYSALSNRVTGTHPHEVQRRTGYEKEICLKILDYLVLHKVAAKRLTGNYQALNPHAVFSSVGGNDGIKIVYLDSLNALRRKASVRFNGSDQLFSQSFFSVRKDRLPEMRKRLRELLQEFVETNELDEGDCIAKLIVGLYS